MLCYEQSWIGVVEFVAARARAEEARCSAGAQWSNKKEGNPGLVELIWQTLGFVIVIAGFFAA